MTPKQSLKRSDLVARGEGLNQRRRGVRVMVYMGLCLFFPLLAVAQPLDLVIEERFRVEYVLLDVLAVDRRGSLVTDLTRREFSLKENGKKIEISYFDTLDFRAPGLLEKRRPLPADRDVEGVNPEPTQLITLVLDLESAKLQQAKKCFVQVREYLSDVEMGPAYRFSLYAMEKGFLTRGFASDRSVLLGELDRYERRFYNSRIGRRNDNHPFLEREAERSGFSVQRGREGLGGVLLEGVNHFSDLEWAFGSCRQSYLSDAEAVNRCINASLNAYFEEQRIRSERIMGELEILTYELEDTQGLKTILFVSPGFALSSLSSAYTLASVYKREQGSTGGRPSIPGNKGRLRLNADFKRVAHACIKNRVMFHTFDIFNGSQSLTRSNSPAFDGPAPASIERAYHHFNLEISSGLKALAEESGGAFFQSFKLKTGLDKALGAGSFYYLLGYQSPKGKRAGTFRKIKLKSKRKGVKLHYRNGYYGR